MAFIASNAVVSVVVNFTTMLVIHALLVVLMANDACKKLIVPGHIVARRTTLPAVAMGTRIDREKLGIVVAKLAFLAGRVALQTIGAVEHVARDAIMLWIHAHLFMFMAGNAREDIAIARVGVAGHAIIPPIIVGS